MSMRETRSFAASDMGSQYGRRNSYSPRLICAQEGWVACGSEARESSVRHRVGAGLYLLVELRVIVGVKGREPAEEDVDDDAERPYVARLGVPLHP